jgi:hypothetical protein
VPRNGSFHHMNQFCTTLSSATHTRITFVNLLIDDTPCHLYSSAPCYQTKYEHHVVSSSHSALMLLVQRLIASSTSRHVSICDSALSNPLFPHQQLLFTNACVYDTAMAAIKGLNSSFFIATRQHGVDIHIRSKSSSGVLSVVDTW